MFRKSLLGTMAVVCAILAQHQGAIGQVPYVVVIASLAAVAGAAVAFPGPDWIRTGDSGPRQQEMQPSDGSARLLWATLAYLLPALLAMAVWLQEPYKAQHQFVHTASTWAAVGWLAGLVVGTSVLFWPVKGIHIRFARPRPAFVATAALLIVILLVAAALRTWHLATVPEGIWLDEVNTADNAAQLRGQTFQPFPLWNFGRNPALYYYAVSGVTWAFGNTIGTVRLAGALFGLASVAGTFALGRQAGGARIAVLAAAFSAVAAWSITFSRIGMPNIPIPAILGFGYATFLVAMQRPRAAWFALSGALLGASFLTYSGAFLPALVPFLILYARCRSDRQFARASASGRLLLPLCLVVAAAPYLSGILLDGAYVLAHVHVDSLFNEYGDPSRRLAGLVRNIRAYLGMFTIAGDHNGRHNLAGAPMLDPIMGTLFLLGLGICVRRITNWRSQLLLACLAANLLSGILSLDYEAPHAARTIGALAVICVICALPLLALPRVLAALGGRLPTWLGAGACHWQRKPGSHRPVAAANVIIGLVLFASLGLNTNRYFIQQAHDMTSWTAMEGRETIIGRAVNAYAGRGYTVYVNTDNLDLSVLRYTASPWQYLPYDPAAALRHAAAGYRVAVLLQPEARVLRYLLQADKNATTQRLTPAFDTRYLQGYIVLLTTQARPQ